MYSMIMWIEEIFCISTFKNKPHLPKAASCWPQSECYRRIDHTLHVPIPRNRCEVENQMMFPGIFYTKFPSVEIRALRQPGDRGEINYIMFLFQSSVEWVGNFTLPRHSAFKGFFFFFQILGHILWVLYYSKMAIVNIQ